MIFYGTILILVSQIDRSEHCICTHICIFETESAKKNISLQTFFGEILVLYFRNSVLLIIDFF